jgi:hypothetical protein
MSIGTVSGWPEIVRCWRGWRWDIGGRMGGNQIVIVRRGKFQNINGVEWLRSGI